MKTTMTTMTSTTTNAITEKDRVVVSGRYLVYKGTGKRFLMRGIAFPIPLNDDRYQYDVDGYVAVLRQLRDLDVNCNTIRLYQLDPLHTDYTEFFRRAAEMGFYALVPLTSASGPGVLNRDMDAPACYNGTLFNYGRRAVDVFSKYPNVIGGVIGNEVMNNLLSWSAAPCLLAYARDLKRYRPNFTLVYTSQHDGMGAEVPAAEAMKLTLDYLTCHESASIDVFGVNIESWCSSLQTFEKNEDGSEGSYLTLYRHLQNATVPIIFSEMGCSQEFFNRDNGLPRFIRDWDQVPVVLNDMADEWSGFVAYAYDGPPHFTMTDGGPWDGVHTLEPNRELYNFRDALRAWVVSESGGGIGGGRGGVGGGGQSNETGGNDADADADAGTGARSLTGSPPSCKDTVAALYECCDLSLFPVEKFPSYHQSWFSWMKQHLRIRGRGGRGGATAEIVADNVVVEGSSPQYLSQNPFLVFVLLVSFFVTMTVMAVRRGHRKGYTRIR